MQFILQNKINNFNGLKNKFFSNTLIIKLWFDRYLSNYNAVIMSTNIWSQ